MCELPAEPEDDAGALAVALVGRATSGTLRVSSVWAGVVVYPFGLGVVDASGCTTAG